MVLMLLHLVAAHHPKIGIKCTKNSDCNDYFELCKAKEG